ncbi:MAG: hypothetical protein Q7U64_14405 [Desulfocapsaceae bacterium]|nr:hypothetical protein [Desulfocapsaceae bacterium]
MEETEYDLPDFEHTISRSDLAESDRETQLEVMRTWFFQNFEDPAERTPYESREGGYIWIWGGPYEAEDELGAEFGGLVDDDVIDELSKELGTICWEWAPTEKPGDYDEYLVDDIAQITEFYHNFSSGILDIKALLKTEVSSPVKNCFFRLLFVNVITALETYLSDAFINSVIPDAQLIRRFVENSPEFKSEKMPLSQVFKAAEEIEQRVKAHLADVVWHNLSRVKPMYRDVLSVTFPQDIGNLTRAVLKRHDIVHRNGKSKAGDEILITQEDVTNLIHEIEKFVQFVDQDLSEARANSWVNKDASR